MYGDRLWFEINETNTINSNNVNYWTNLYSLFEKPSSTIGDIYIFKSNLLNPFRSLPAKFAFKSIMDTIRKIVKDKQEKGLPFLEDLFALYRLAAIYSYRIRVSEKYNLNGDDILLRTPGGLLFSLECPYYRIGYNKLELLLKRDKEIISKYYGNPEEHSTYNILYNEVWLKYEMLLKYEGPSVLMSLLEKK